MSSSRSRSNLSALIQFLWVLVFVVSVTNPSLAFAGDNENEELLISAEEFFLLEMLIDPVSALPGFSCACAAGQTAPCKATDITQCSTNCQSGGTTSDCVKCCSYFAPSVSPPYDQCKGCVQACGVSNINTQHALCKSFAGSGGGGGTPSKLEELEVPELQ